MLIKINICNRIFCYLLLDDFGDLDRLLELEPDDADFSRCLSEEFLRFGETDADLLRVLFFRFSKADLRCLKKFMKICRFK